MAGTRVSKKPGPRHVLVIPRQAHTVSISLRWGADLLMLPNAALMTGALFHALREALNVEIRSDQPEKVARALGLPIGEPGIVRIQEVR